MHQSNPLLLKVLTNQAQLKEKLKKKLEAKSSPKPEIASSLNSESTPVREEPWLTVPTPSHITITPQRLVFKSINGSIPGPQFVSLTAVNNNYQFNLEACAKDTWLIVAPSTGITPSTVKISVNPTGLERGIYCSKIYVFNTSRNVLEGAIHVRLQVGIDSAEVLQASPHSLTFITKKCVDPEPQTLVISTTLEPPLPQVFDVEIITSTLPNGWIKVTPTEGKTPSLLTVSIDTEGLETGVYKATLEVSPRSNPELKLLIPVTLFVVKSCKWEVLKFFDKCF